MILLFLILFAAPLEAAVDPAAYRRLAAEQKLENAFASFSAPPFTVFPEKPLASPLVRSMQKTIADTVSQAGYAFGYTPSGPMRIVLYQGTTYDSIDDPEIASGGFYRDKKIRIRFDFAAPAQVQQKAFDEVFRHEYTHLVVAALDAGKCPRWLNEGLAVYAQTDPRLRRSGEGRAFARRLAARGRAPSYRELVQTDLKTLYSLKGAEFYEHSYILAKYLIERYGYGKVRELFRAMKEGRSFKEAFAAVYGEDPEKNAAAAYDA